MSDDASSGWLRSIFRRGPAEPPPPTPDPTPVQAEQRPALPASPGGVLYYRLQSANGETLSLAPGASLLGAQETLDPALAVVAIVPQAHSYLCLLATQDVRPFHITGDTLTGPCISARILRSPARGIVRLKQPLTGLRFLSLDALDPNAPAATQLRFDGQGNTMAAAFRLLPLAETDITAALRTLADSFGAAASAGLRQTDLVMAMRAGRVRADLAEALLRLLSREELDDLSRRLLDEPQTLSLLKALLPKDPYLQTFLPALVAWRSSRTPAGTAGQLNSPGTDETLLLPSMDEAGVPPGLALLGLARGHIAPTKNFCILATARNEGPYLLEWLAYHLSIGFEHVFLYTNDNTDGSGELLSLLARHEVITLVQNERGQRIGVQEKANAHALTLLPQILDYRWTAVMDLDEYIAFDTNAYDTLADFIGLHEAQAVDAVALCWLIFTSRYGEPYQRGLTTERFPFRSDDVNRHVKTIFRTRRFWGSQPHYPYSVLNGPFFFRSEDGGTHHHPGILDRIPAFSQNPTATMAWMNHYMFRSAPEALWKLVRGDASWLSNQDADQRKQREDFVAKAFSDFATSTRLVNDTRVAACSRGQAAMLEKLLALPGVAEAEETVRFNFEVTLGQLAENFLASPVPYDAAPSLLRFREALAVSTGATPIPLVAPIRSPVV